MLKYFTLFCGKLQVFTIYSSHDNFRFNSDYNWCFDRCRRFVLASFYVVRLLESLSGNPGEDGSFRLGARLLGGDKRITAGDVE